MGIPRFYRYVSERYPLINQPISDVSLLPEFDCFYLDMNGIIHNCTHTDAADGELSTLGLPAQLHNIFTYMDRLITHIIKPKKLVYIAIDGVAPRAKLNQQRSRRFRAGMEREEALAKERHRQISLQDEKDGNRGAIAAPTQRFDSNCITPGTQFLFELSTYLVWFVRYKMKNDPLWSRLEVYYSGSEVPGEGEHKIVDFIRHRKMAPGYEPNVRHCMYGSDADLMLLGLMTHEPHFTLVREVVVWGQQKSNKVVAKKIQEEQWQLVHLSLFREYLMMEMRVVPPLNGERMLDDFILLTYLLGNDFIPHSPTLEISEDAIPLLMRVYREHLEKYAGQYLTEDGELINIPMLQDLFVTIGAMEEDILIDRAAEEARRNKHKRGGERVRSKQVEVVEEDVKNALALLNDDDDEDDDKEGMPALIDDDEDDDIGISEDDEMDKKLLEALDGEEAAKLALEMEKEEREIFSALSGSESFQDTKWTYYERKFGIKPGNRSGNNKELQKIKKHYMEAIVWCLRYYFQGPPSWSWYYPYHYAPMISDLTDIEDVVKNVRFGNDPDADGPLRPFEQLMANLPASSAHLVPEPYRFLMMSPLSPIKHFYPVTFDIDMEGKRNPWEGVNILPFIDSALLKSAIAQYCPDDRLTEAERKRNKLQKAPLRIWYDPLAFETVPSCLPGVPGFGDIIACSTRVAPYELPPIQTNGGRFESKLMDGVTLPMAGFPSLYTIPLEAVRVEHIRVNCFGMGSRKATLILQLPPTGPIEQAVNPHELLGNTALVNWPNLHEAKVMGISTLTGEYRIDESSGRVEFKHHEPEKKTLWAQYAQSECYQLLSGRGTPGSGGLDLGKMGISVVLHVLPLQGMVSNPITGAVEKKFGQSEAVVPLQLAVVNRKLFDARFEESGPMALEERFPKDSVALITRGKWLGCTATVQETVPASNKVRVHVNTIDKEPPFGYVIAQQIADKYYPGYMVAQKLGISTTTLGLLTGSVYLKPGDFEIGLNLRFRKELLLPGFCRLVSKANTNGSDGQRDENVWTKGDIVKIVGSDVTLNGGEKTQSRRPGGNGNGGGTTWEYTDRTIAVLAAYKAEFPEVFANLDKLPFATSYGGKEIFGTTDKKTIEKKAEAIVAWIDAQRLGKKEHSKHIPLSSQYMSLNAMRAVEVAGSLRAKEREKHAALEKTNPVVAEVFAGDLFRPNPLVNQDLTGSMVAEAASKNPGPPRLGDRVINISSRGVPFGHRGTIVATHVSSKCVEVLFDEGFTGGEPLYGSTTLDRGKIVVWNNVMCISSPPGLENPREREHVQVSAEPPRRASKQTHEKTSKSGKDDLVVSSNSRKPRKPSPGNQNPPRILTPAMVAAAAAKPFVPAAPPAPPAAPATPAPPPPDPAKIKSLLKKWTGEQSAEVETSETAVASTEIESEALAPTVAALFNSAAAAAAERTDEVVPSVAALFTAAAAAAPQPVDQAPPNPLAGLFPLGSSGPAPPLPPFPPTQGMLPPQPPHYVHSGHPHGLQPGFLNPYAMTPPLPPHPYPYPGAESPPQSQPQRDNRRGSSKKAAAPAPVASLAEYPPLGADPKKKETKAKATKSPEPAPAASSSTDDQGKRTKQKWVPKADKPAAPSKAQNLLLPSQVMRQQPKPASAPPSSD